MGLAVTFASEFLPRGCEVWLSALPAPRPHKRVCRAIFLRVTSLRASFILSLNRLRGSHGAPSDGAPSDGAQNDGDDRAICPPAMAGAASAKPQNRASMRKGAPPAAHSQFQKNPTVYSCRDAWDRARRLPPGRHQLTTDFNRVSRSSSQSLAAELGRNPFYNFTVFRRRENVSSIP